MRPTLTLCIPVFLKNVVFKPAKQKSDFFTPFNPTRKKSLKDVTLLKQHETDVFCKCCMRNSYTLKGSISGGALPSIPLSFSFATILLV